MRKYLIVAHYSARSWARMMQTPDDRRSAVDDFLRSVGGSVEAMNWQAGSGTAYIVCDLPGSRAVVAVQLTVFKTGGYDYIEAHELLTEEQLTDALDRAVDASKGWTEHPVRHR